MPDAEAERIADGLAEHLRRDLMRLAAGDHHPGLAIFMLICRGLADYRRRWFLFGPRVVVLTPLGLRVRRILEAWEADHG